MVGESNQKVSLIKIDASNLAEFEIYEFELLRVDCIWQKLLKVYLCALYSDATCWYFLMSNIVFIFNKSTLYKYSDDNTLCFIHCDIDVLRDNLIDESLLLIEWFDFNAMKVNPDKCQTIFLWKKTHELTQKFEIGDTLIECADNVTILKVDWLNVEF